MAWIWVSNLADWLQKWQSSGHPPVLADRMPSTSTVGAAPGQPDLVGQRGQRGHGLVRQRGQGRQLLERELAALVEQGVAGGGDQGAGHGPRVVAGRRGPPTRPRRREEV